MKSHKSEKCPDCGKVGLHDGNDYEDGGGRAVTEYWFCQFCTDVEWQWTKPGPMTRNERYAQAIKAINIAKNKARLVSK